MSPTLSTPPAFDLAAMSAGFADVATGSQAVFRSVQHAFAHPGRVVRLQADAELPHPGQAASLLVLLALLDAETCLWLSPALARNSARQWLQFHCGCTLVDAPLEADFVWAADLSELPALSQLRLGSDERPELAATCVVDVASFCTDGSAAPAWRLSGPGIASSASLQVFDGTAQTAATQARFFDLRAASHAAFPRGVDVLLCSATHVVGLPRSTQIRPSAAQEV